jgi:hypothetical protein
MAQPPAAAKSRRAATAASAGRRELLLGRLADFKGTDVHRLGDVLDLCRVEIGSLEIEPRRAPLQSIEPVTFSGHSDDQPRLQVGFDLAAQTYDHRVDAAVERLERSTGDRI